MTDTNVRNVLFDPRSGWVLISGGVYLGTSRVLTRGAAMSVLAHRERLEGLREPSRQGERTCGQRDGYEALKAAWDFGEKRYEARLRARRET